MAIMAKRAKGKVTLYVDIPEGLKLQMDKLAVKHHRTLGGETAAAIEAWINHCAVEDAAERLHMHAETPDVGTPSRQKGGGR
jgi:hypothetical protein